MTALLRSLLLTAAFVSLAATGLRADPKDEVTPTVAPPEETNIPVSQEFTVEGSYDGFSETKQGSAKIGDVNNSNERVDYVVSPQVTDSVLLRFGVDAERNSFSLPNNAPLPNTLQSVNAILGADLAFGDKIIVRVEAHPGVFSDFTEITGSDFDMPVQIGGTYLYSKDLQFIFGIQIDLKSNFPLIGLPGVRWQFADKWVLDAIPPKPRLEYELSPAVTLYTGLDILSGTYHLNDQFGTYHGHAGGNTSDLNGNIVDFTELRAGVGFTWKFLPNLTLDVSGGYMPYRDFDIHQDKIGFNPDETSFHNNVGDGAPYAEAGISGSF